MSITLDLDLIPDIIPDKNNFGECGIQIQEIIELFGQHLHNIYR